MGKHLKYWIPAICVAVLISTFSTHYFSSAETSKILIPLLHWIFHSASPHTLSRMHTAIRKLAHITEFGLFSTALFHGVRADRSGWRSPSSLPHLTIPVNDA